MRKTIFGLVAVFAIATLVWATDPWKSKPYQQWDQKDVQKILNDSPWAKVIQEDANWKGFSAPSGLPDGSSAPSGGGGGGGGGGARGGMGAPGGGAPGGGAPGEEGGGAPGGGMGEQGGAGIQQVPFKVLWASSQTIREALARNSELRGQPDSQAEQQLARPMDSYQIMVFGPDMTPFRGIEENDLKSKSVLLAKKSKQRIQPSSVQIQRNPSGDRIQAVVFSFPKRSESGEATIGPEEKGAEFQLSIPNLNLRTSFDFSKMTTSQGRDI